ncbi:ring finger protein 212B [Turdus rufiventris]|nr:ring finger protein 212B [Turdus rufiventris]
MDWFHCWRCFRQEGAQFAVTTCGHILCEDCGGTGPCPVCTTACHYLSLSQQMRPDMKIFFKNPAELAHKHLAHITKVRRTQVMGDEVPPLSPTPRSPQVCQFQLAQAQLKADAHQDRARQAQAKLEKVVKEMGEMKRLE